MLSCEYNVKEVLPLIRRALAEELRSRGFSVSEIAEMLGTTPSAVSQYLKGKRGKGIPEEVKEEARKLADIAERMKRVDRIMFCRACLEVMIRRENRVH